MNIKELETITGVIKQNIRFYEKKGLISPERNPQNDYREYTEGDVERLQLVKVFRMLDMSIEDIKKLLEREVPLEELMVQHLTYLEEEEKRLNAAVEICRTLQNKNLGMIDAVQILKQMGEIEKSGGKFKKIVEDYKKVAAGEQRKSFAFISDIFIGNPSEFTQALFQYADDEKVNLVITKEGMYPEFLIDGVEYTAYRAYFRFGPMIQCEMVHPEKAEATDVPEADRRKYKWARRLTVPALILVLLLIMMGSRGWDPLFLLLVLVIIAGMLFIIFINGR